VRSVQSAHTYDICWILDLDLRLVWYSGFYNGNDHDDGSRKKFLVVATIQLVRFEHVSHSLRDEDLASEMLCGALLYKTGNSDLDPLCLP